MRNQASRNITPSVTPKLYGGLGITQIDVIIRNGLIAAMQDLRDNPWELEVALSSLLDDPLTQGIYGQKLVDKGIRLFMSTNIPVILDVNLNGPPAMPVIIVSIADCQEAEATLSDVHYEPERDIQADWEPLTRPFSAAYDPATGILTPHEDLIVHPKMLVVDSQGKEHKILGNVVQENGPTLIKIDKGLVGSWSSCKLVWATGRSKAQLRSLMFKENVSIQLAVKGSADPLLLLFPIMLYAILKGKRGFWQARGFDRSTISYSGVELNNELSQTGSENIFCRTINVMGFSQHAWVDSTPGKLEQSQTVVGQEGQILPEPLEAFLNGSGF